MKNIFFGRLINIKLYYLTMMNAVYQGEQLNDQGAHQGIIPNPPNDGFYANQEEKKEEQTFPKCVVYNGIGYHIKGPEEYESSMKRCMFYHPLLQTEVTVAQYEAKELPMMIDTELAWAYNDQGIYCYIRFTK